MIKLVSIVHALNDKDLIFLFTALKKLHLKGLLGKEKKQVVFHV